MFSTDETLNVDLKKLAPLQTPPSRQIQMAANTASMIDGDVAVAN